MKRLFISATVLVISSTFISVNGQDKNLRPTKEQGQDQPYKLSVNNVVVGNPVNAQKVLRIWKYWEDNQMEKAGELYDDAIIVRTTDGSVIKGKDEVIKASKASREAVSSYTVTIDACVPLKTPDRADLEAVSVWAAETRTGKDGTITKTYGNSVWFFNKEGKVVELREMEAKLKE